MATTAESGGVLRSERIAGLLSYFGGHAAPVNYAGSHWLPGPTNFTFYGTVILALPGIEVPLNMGVEINQVRSITRYLLWGSVVVMAAYLIGTFCVMVAVPLKDQGSPSAIAEAVLLGFGSAGPVLGIVVNIIRRR